MALPTPIKTWLFTKINQIIPAQGSVQNTRKFFFLAHVNSLLGFVPQRWFVNHSCNASVAGAPGDGINRWATIADLTWQTGANARSWMVLSNPSLHPNFQLLLECFRSVGGTLELGVRASWTAHASGFTGGTTTAPPTATWAVPLRDGVAGSSGSWGEPGGTGDFTAVLHVMQSTDGECTRIFTNVSNFTTSMWLFDKAIPCHAGWNPAIVGMIHGMGALQHAPTYALLNVPAFTSTVPPAASRGVSAMQLAFTGEGHRGALEGSILQIPNDLVSPPEYHLGPIGLSSETSANRGRHGNLVDIWWGNAGLAHGAGIPASPSYPSSPLRQFVQFRDIIVPWNADKVLGVDGSVCLLA